MTHSPITERPPDINCLCITSDYMRGRTYSTHFSALRSPVLLSFRSLWVKWTVAIKIGRNSNINFSLSMYKYVYNRTRKSANMKEVADPWVSFMSKMDCFPKTQSPVVHGWHLHKAEERGKTRSQSNSIILLKATFTDLLLFREKWKRPESVEDSEAAFAVYLSTCVAQRKGPTCKLSYSREV